MRKFKRKVENSKSIDSDPLKEKCINRRQMEKKKQEGCAKGSHSDMNADKVSHPFTGLLCFCKGKEMINRIRPKQYSLKKKFKLFLQGGKTKHYKEGSYKFFYILIK